MTEEQIQYLKENDIPYSPSLFEYHNHNFQKYLAHLRLCAYRGFKWSDSHNVEEGVASWYKKLKESNND